MPRFTDLNHETDDLSCMVCATPLLNKKSTCPKCGSKWGQVAAAPAAAQSEAPPQERIPGGHFVESPSAAKGNDTILTMLMVFMSGIALLYALINPLIDTFSMETLWRSLSILILSLIMLGVRQMLIRPRD